MKKRPQLKVSIASNSVPTAESVMLRSQELMEPRPDPNLETIQQYEVYYNTAMKSLCEQRMRLMNESADTAVAQSHQERNRYQNITALLKS